MKCTYKSNIELLNEIEEYEEEIERLKERIENLNTINEEHQILNGMIRKELQQKENIIKEVSKELKEFNEFYLEDEGDTGVYEYLNKLIEKLKKGE